MDSHKGSDVASNVALVSPYFWPERLGCALYFTDVARFLTTQFGTVDVFTAIPHYPSKKSAMDSVLSSDDSVRIMKIRRAWLFDRSKGGFVVRVCNDLLFAVQVMIQSILARKPCSAALILVPTALAIPAMRLLHPRARLVAVVYDIESTLARATRIVTSRIVSSWLDTVEAWCINRADSVLVLSPQMEQVLVSIGVKRPVAVVPIWTAIQADQPAAKSHSNTLMYSGGLARRHGSDALPEFWRRLNQRLSTCRLIIQGEDSQIDKVRAALLSTGGELVFRPIVQREMLAQSLAEADLQLVLVSAEAADSSMPSKAVNCLAAGVPFLTNAPRNSVLAEFALESGGGHVVPDGSPDELAAAAANLLANPTQLRQMGASGQKYVRTTRDPDQLRQLYSDLLLGTH
jgi:colanic acid biosynthesis glycosyl transferase WcaI